MNYIAGDALAVIPANDPALADALIDKLGLSPDSPGSHARRGNRKPERRPGSLL